MTSVARKVSLWKLGREIRRLKGQLGAVGSWMIGTARRGRYDRNRSSLVRETEGSIQVFAEAAVVLIYQPGGLLPSTLFTLSWLAGKGIAPVVVSNHPLRDADRTKLAARSHLVIERPNLGYDFGGYREGVLTILSRGIALDCLYVLNDSMWFPLRENCDTIEKCRAAKEDIFGLHLSFLSKSSTWNEHVQSYFFRFSKRLLEDQSFRDYWQNLPLMGSKLAVVRLCERRLSWHFAERGFSFGGLIHWNSVVNWLLSEQDDARLKRVFQYQCSVGPKEASLMEPLFAQGMTAKEVRDHLADLIRARKIFPTMVSLSPELLLSLGVPFLKKARTRDMVLQREEIRRLRLADDFIPAFRDEILVWDDRQRIAEMVAKV